MKTNRHGSAVMTAILGAALVVGACSSGPGGPAATASAGVPSSGAPSAPAGGSAAPSQVGGATPGSPGSANANDACTVLSDEDFQRIAGATVVNRIPANQLGLFTNGCLYELTEDGSRTTANIGVLATGGKAFYASTIENGGFTPAEGPADKVVRVLPGSNIFLKGDVLFSVTYFGPNGPDDATSIEFARAIIANLGL